VAAPFSEPARKILVKPFIDIPGLNLELMSRTNEEKLVSWSPNYRTQTGISLSYAGLIGVAASAKSGMSRQDETAMGKSDYTDIRVRLPWRSISVEVGYQKLKGFYADNTQEFSPGTSGYLKRPDLSLESKYASVVFVLQPNRYSLAAALDHSERQLASGGSFLGAAHVIDTTFDNGSEDLIPTELHPHFGSEAAVNDGRFFSATAGGGYGHMWRFGETGYVFTQLLIGLGFQVGRSRDEQRSFETNELAGMGKFDFGIGSNGELLLGGLLISIDQTSNFTPETELAKRNFMVQLFAGFRI
jgi:hypothetical protein